MSHDGNDISEGGDPDCDNAAVRQFAARVSARNERGLGLPEVVTELLPTLLGDAGVVRPEFRRPIADGYARYPLYRHPSGLFSIQVMVFGPGMATPIHDHRSWCVVGVHEGEERETSFTVVGENEGQRVVATGSRIMRCGDVCCHYPDRPNIHRVENASPQVSISLHIYGFDTAYVKSSIARQYSP